MIQVTVQFSFLFFMKNEAVMAQKPWFKPIFQIKFFVIFLICFILNPLRWIFVFFCIESLIILLVLLVYAIPTRIRISEIEKLG